MKLRLGTRGSRLALTQSAAIAAALERAGHEVETIVLKTLGDKILDAPLANLGGKGLFTKEIDEALLDRRIDLAVHSLKDVPSIVPPGLAIVAYPPREDARDAFIGRTAARLEDLPNGARVGTASLRRSCQLGALRPDLRIELLRGNVDTRLGKLDRGEYDAILLAAAGLNRLGFAARATELLDPERFVPAAGQGILAIEARQADGPTVDALRVLSDPRTETAAACERAFLSRLEGGCQVPMGGWARIDLEGGELRLTAFVGTSDGARLVRAARSAPSGSGVREAHGLGVMVAEELLAHGAREILEALKGLAGAQGAVLVE